MKIQMTNVLPMVRAEPTLEEHTRDCQERYLEVIARLDGLDKRMSTIEQLLVDIRGLIK